MTLLAALILAGCGSRVAGSDGDGGPAPSGSTSTPATSDRAVASARARDAPPEAALAAEGGDPVPGQLGSYTWDGSGSDSPWLPGTPITVGAGESLSVTLAPPAATGTWRARYVPAGQTDAEGARPLGEGSTTPTFPAPPAGRWTVEVQVTFPDAAGAASYFWEIVVD